MLRSTNEPQGKRYSRTWGTSLRRLSCIVPSAARQDAQNWRLRPAGFHRLTHVVSPLQLAGRTYHGFPGLFRRPLCIALLAPEVEHRRAGRFLLPVRRVVKSSRRLSIARRAHYSLADQAPAKIADFAVFRQLERLSCAAFDREQPSERRNGRVPNSQTKLPKNRGDLPNVA